MAAADADAGIAAGFDPHDLLEMHAWLACMGPESFRPAVAWIRLAPDPRRGEALDWLLDPANREAASRAIGGQLASSLATRGRETQSPLLGLLPGLVAVDAACGFAVLREAAAALPAASTRDFGEAVLTLALAEGAAAAKSDDADGLRHRDRLGCLLEALASLDRDPEARARLFLALSQTLDPALVRSLVVPTTLFPSAVAEGATVLSEGTDDALRAMLYGASTRPRGRAEFFEACRTAMEAGLEAGLPMLGRLARLLDDADRNVKALESLVRAAALTALERAAQRGPGPAAGIPPDADTWTLRLLAAVAPALPEPHRSSLCDAIVSRAADRLRTARVGTIDADAFVEAVVNAAVVHADPEVPAAEVRRMLLETAGLLRVQMFATDRPPEALFDVSMAFEGIAASLGSEFRRRRSLASALASVLPMVTDLSAPPEAPAATLFVD